MEQTIKAQYFLKHRQTEYFQWKDDKKVSLKDIKSVVMIVIMGQVEIDCFTDYISLKIRNNSYLYLLIINYIKIIS